MRRYFLREVLPLFSPMTSCLIWFLWCVGPFLHIRHCVPTPGTEPGMQWARITSVARERRRSASPVRPWQKPEDCAPGENPGFVGPEPLTFQRALLKENTKLRKKKLGIESETLFREKKWHQIRKRLKWKNKKQVGSFPKKKKKKLPASHRRRIESRLLGLRTR